MRSPHRAATAWLPADLSPAAWRTAWVIGIGVFFVGLSYGAISQASGFPLWQTALLAAFATGGAAELTFVGVIAAGGSPVFAVLGGLLVNSRNFAFGLSVGECAPRGWRRWLGAHLVNDETTAFARTGTTPRMRWHQFVAGALLLFPCWILGSVLGQWMGSVVDMEALGIDAAFPVILFCMVAQDVKHSPMGLLAAGGAALAVAATPLLPLGLGAPAGLLVLVPATLVLSARDRRRRAAPARSPQIPEQPTPEETA